MAGGNADRVGDVRRSYRAAVKRQVSGIRPKRWFGPAITALCQCQLPLCVYPPPDSAQINVWPWMGIVLSHCVAGWRWPVSFRYWNVPAVLLTVINTMRM